jgi:hypothetical protein
MFTAPQPFPMPGSWAIWESGSVVHAARIQKTAKVAGQVWCLVSLPELGPVASGNRTVPMAELHDSTPLGAAEREELFELGLELNRLERPELSRRYARFEALRHRQIRAADLARRLAALERRGFATPATRAARAWLDEELRGDGRVETRAAA